MSEKPSAIVKSFIPRSMGNLLEVAFSGFMELARRDNLALLPTWQHMHFEMHNLSEFDDLMAMKIFYRLGGKSGKVSYVAHLFHRADIDGPTKNSKATIACDIEPPKTEVAENTSLKIPASLLSFEHDEIYAVLPHGGNWSLLDRIIVSTDSSCPCAIAHKTIWLDDPFLQGHDWAYNGPLMIELLSQAAAMYSIVTFSDLKGKPGYTGGGETKVGAQVNVGDTLIIRVDFTVRKKDILYFDGIITKHDGTFVMSTLIRGAALGE